MDNNGSVIAPIVVRPVNQHDMNVLPESIDELSDFAELIGFDLQNSYLTLDSGFHSDFNKRIIQNLQIIPVIKPNRRGIKSESKLEKLFENFHESIYKQRFKIERTFAWQDTYRKLVTCYDRLKSIHLGFKYISYSLLNLRLLF